MVSYPPGPPQTASAPSYVGDSRVVPYDVCQGVGSKVKEWFLLGEGGGGACEDTKF